ncbi:hypothetical protein [Streptosporangium sp. NPDC006930]|uniref:hypothetical protein n=1 Tax=unclassified Streptosporangium TaxID=2632669 RepID=UPI0034169EE3
MFPQACRPAAGDPPPTFRGAVSPRETENGIAPRRTPFADHRFFFPKVVWAGRRRPRERGDVRYRRETTAPPLHGRAGTPRRRDPRRRVREGHSGPRPRGGRCDRDEGRSAASRWTNHPSRRNQQNRDRRA